MSATKATTIQEIDEFLALRVAERDIAKATNCWADVLDIDEAIDLALARRVELTPVER